VDGAFFVAFKKDNTQDNTYDKSKKQCNVSTQKTKKHTPGHFVVVKFTISH